MKIDFILGESKKEIKKVKGKINKSVKSITNYGKKNEDLEYVSFLANKIFPDIIKPMFIQDTHYKKGKIKVKKCVRNVFKENKYKQKLYEYLKVKAKDKNASLLDFCKYHDFEELNEDLEVLEDVFNVVVEGLTLIKEDVEKEIYSSVDLQAFINILITRLSQLYNIYGIYLEDLNCLAEYTSFWNMFVGITKILSDIFEKSKAVSATIQ